MAPRVHRSTQAGYTLIEMIGVLAILAILVTMITPSIIERIRHAQISKEAKTLPTLGEALQRHILRHKNIPNAMWAQVIADELAAPIRQVGTSVAGNPRVFLIDPEFQIGDHEGLPYDQTEEGATAAPVHARVMFISSQGRPLPSLIASGLASDPEIFENIWNAARDTVPIGWPAEWDRQGEALQIHRMNLAPLFHRVLVSDLTTDGTPSIAIDGGEAFEVPEGGLSAFYLKETALAFYHDGDLDFRDLLMSDRGYVYERGFWRGQLIQGKSANASSFARALDGFLNARLNPSAPGADQQTVTDGCYGFALSYAAWARAGFPAYDELNQVTPEYQALHNAQNRMEAATANLIVR